MDEIPIDELRKFVRQFLIDLKNLIYDKGLIVQNREVNKQNLLELGLTGKQREEIVISLSVADYCSGPTKDMYQPGDYWIFGKIIDGDEIYIKLKIVGQQGEEFAVCFSFHKSEHSLKYPFA